MTIVLLKRIAHPAATLILTLAGVEILCRLFLPPASLIRFEQDKEVLGQIRLQQLTSLLQEDSELFWKFKPNQTLGEHQRPFFGVISNSRGVREDHEVSLHPPRSETRILFLGDSCTFGYGVAHSETFSERLERLLKRDPGTERVECINAGVPGYSLFQGWRYYATDGKGYGARLVAACFGWNDSSVWDSMSDLEHHEMIRQSQPIPFLRGSRLAGMVTAALRRPDPHRRARAEPRPRLLPEEFKALLNDLHQEVSRQDAQLLLLVWPLGVNLEPDNENARTPLQMATYEFAKENGVMLVDLVPVFIKAVSGRPTGVNELFFDEGHVTERGHALVSSALAEFLVPKVGDPKKNPLTEVHR